MKISYNVTGAERKLLAAAISKELNVPTKYLGMPTAAYEVGSWHIDKTGTVTGTDNPELVAALAAQGFKAVNEEYETPTAQIADTPDCYTYQAELSDPDCPDRMEVFSADNDEDAIRQAREFCEGDVTLLELNLLDDDYNVVRGVEIKPERLVIQMPLDGFTTEKLDNLCKLVTAKSPLIKAAIGADDLPIQQTAETLDFPWFKFTEDSDTVNAYSALVSLLCKTATQKKRITSKEKGVEGSPKYAMRCFLLSLGFIGDEYKTARKILLSKLEGNSSWKNGKKAEVTADE